ncbi:hypothetical protein BLX41_18655 [Pseudomonas protegens]|uniref:hypothetical protein n=1 Tax=Pseudomonas protegens TaxID=380021 RepID=UPI000F4B5C89|nr:hypothetical protein [Pseudomonas protegens]ROL73061.1 hypothetical protein BLX41_18655 [Pseudomonas protegens]
MGFPGLQQGAADYKGTPGSYRCYTSILSRNSGVKIMSKGMNAKKNAKKKPAKSADEKRAEKKAKKTEVNIFGH